MKKIRIKIENKIFDIGIRDEEFASFLENDLSNLNIKNVKSLLSSYVKKSYELYSLEKKLKNFMDKNSIE